MPRGIVNVTRAKSDAWRIPQEVIEDREARRTFEATQPVSEARLLLGDPLVGSGRSALEQREHNAPTGSPFNFESAHGGRRFLG